MANLSDWQGRVGEVWADHADALDPVLAPFGDAALDTLGDLKAKRVLDLGCGAGQTCAALVRRGAVTTGVDVSQHLIDVARTRDPEISYALVLGDAAAVEYSRSFDVVFSRFGSMFFDKPVAAFAHLRGAMAADGRYCGAAWCAFAENDWARVPFDLANEVLGAPQAGSAGPGPFAWADRSVFEDVFQAAGWRDIRAEKVTRDVTLALGDADDGLDAGVAFAMKIGPAASALKAANDEVRALVRAALRKGLAKHMKDGEVRLSGTAWIIQATA